MQIYQKISEQYVTKKQSLSMTPRDFYTRRLNDLNEALTQLVSKRKLLGALRLFFFLAALITGWALLSNPWYIPFAAFVPLFGAFLFAVSKDLANNTRIANVKRLITINEHELEAIEHRFLSFNDGKKWEPQIHDYAADLDIFGHASLFQFINRAKSEPGKQLFASWLLEPAQTGAIIARQNAVKELATRIPWLQQVQAHGEAKTIESSTRDRILDWLKEPVSFSNRKGWRLFRVIFPLVSFFLLVIHLIGIIPSSAFFTRILIMLMLAFYVSKLIMPAYTKLNRITAELDTLSEIVRCIEREEFHSQLLIDLKEAYATEELAASASIRLLRKILDRLDYRLNPVVFLPLSAFLCWDLLQVMALEKWKQKQVNRIPEWFSALAAIESLGSLATLSFNYPDWCFPAISRNDAELTANGMGHPLIPSVQRVTSDFSTVGTGRLNLVTGSNMAGKSTFLRSAGINTIMAMAGGPVCANSFTVSPMKIMSSMRISDNLEENTSTFYAELKKLKNIIEAVNNKEPIFLLLDEILRGTNSADRHTGSAALITQLLSHDAAGILATHDLELAKLETKYPGKLFNYHFDVQVEGEELFFDYKLKKGVCTSMNASLLMKKIGIEL